MAKKEKLKFPGPSDLGHDFSDDDFILNYRPTIEFVEPAQEPLFEDFIPPIEEPTIDSFRQRTEDLIKSYQAIQQLAEQAQKRIDNRVVADGGFDMKLDPVTDAHVISAIKRCMPNSKDPTTITFQDYKDALACLAAQTPDLPLPTQKDIQDAKSDPTRTNFGGLNNKGGQNRPEVNSAASTVKPLDLSAFQAAGVVALFALLLPMVKAEDKAEVDKHLMSAKHGP